ncbi:hypothetical protein OC835_004316 [Tilletia horrida]|nr:hypothetical protein OC835_004316 [Tilletia horrida]
MVAVGNATLPIDRRMLDVGAELSIRATLWGIDPVQGAFAPLEFAFLPSSKMADPTPELDRRLADSIAAILKEADLDTILGLATVSSDNDDLARVSPVLEMTFGRANVTVPGDLFVEQPTAVETLWDLASIGRPDQPRATCKKKCVWMGGKHYPSRHKNDFAL